MTTRIKKIFVSFTSDIEKEVLQVTEKVIGNINKILHETHSNVSLESKTWKDIAPSLQSGCTAQDIIDLQLENSDVLLAFFWIRFGSPCGKVGYLSGMQWEIDRMIQLGKRVLVYFLNKPIEQKILADQDYLEQYNLLMDYKKKLQTNHGLYRECNYNELESVLENDCTEIIFSALVTKLLS